MNRSRLLGLVSLTLCLFTVEGCSGQPVPDASVDVAAMVSVSPEASPQPSSEVRLHPIASHTLQALPLPTATIQPTPLGTVTDTVAGLPMTSTVTRSPRLTSPAVTVAVTPTLRPMTPTAIPSSSPTSAPTATWEPTATPSAIPLPTADAGWAAYAGDAPRVEEASITINTFAYDSALVPTAEDDPVYPYPRLDHERVGSPLPKTHRAIVLENRYLELTILPDLGGRIYRWVDKASGKNLFYQNPVIKPTTWGHRGWWLATGGMEWALPLDEHGLSEASWWDYELRQGVNLASVTVSNIEERSGLVSEITISLDADHAYFTLIPEIANPGDAPVSFKFWLNGMFGLGSQQVGPGLEFVLPGGEVFVHSTGDDSLPDGGELMDWPVFEGRDLSDYGTWTSYLGAFAAPSAQADYMGAYSNATDLGVVRIFPHETASGAKIFGMGNIDPARWTIDESSYFELWGGLAPTFEDETVLEGGDSITWQERWYAVADMGGFDFANEEAALRLDVDEPLIHVAVATTRPLIGYLTLWRDGEQVRAWRPLSVSPTRSFQRVVTPPGGRVTGSWGLSLHDQEGSQVAAVGETGATAVVH